MSITALLWIWTFLSFYISSDIPLSNFLRVFSFDKSTLSFAIWILFLFGLKDVIDASRETVHQKKEALQIKASVEKWLVANPGLSKAPTLMETRQQLSSLYKDIGLYEGWFAKHLRKLLEVAHRQRTHVSQEPFITLLDQKVHISDHKTN